MIFYENRNFQIRDALLEDVLYLRNWLRKSDIEELWATSRSLPERGLLNAYLISERPLSIVYKDKVVGMFGVCSTDPYHTTGSVWFLASDDVASAKKTFLKLSRKVAAMFLSRYSTICNYVDAENTKSIEWLKWCGANLSEPAPHGPDKKLFRYFTISKESSHV